MIVVLFVRIWFLAELGGVGHRFFDVTCCTMVVACEDYVLIMG